MEGKHVWGLKGSGHYLLRRRDKEVVLHDIPSEIFKIFDLSKILLTMENMSS